MQTILTNHKETAQRSRNHIMYGITPRLHPPYNFLLAYEETMTILKEYDCRKSCAKESNSICSMCWLTRLHMYIGAN